MHSKHRHSHAIFGATLRPESAVLGIVILLLFLLFLFLFMFVTALRAQGQTYSVLHDFTNGSDGALPFPGVMMDAKGNLYGTTNAGGTGYGTVYKMSRLNSAWQLTPLYIFQSWSDGAEPVGGVIRDENGNLYGTTSRGGSSQWGTVFELTPPTSIGASWKKTTLFNFDNGSDGGSPFDTLTFDPQGNLYGTAYFGGNLDQCGDGCGLVFKLAPSETGWTETVLHAFLNGSDGADPFAGVTFDSSGNLYGTATEATYTCGLMYQLAPSGSEWTYSVLYTFTGRGDGCEPAGGVIFDQAGNLYGTTPFGGFWWHGTVFELSPSNGNWNFNVLLRFSGTSLIGPGGPSDCMFQNPRGPTSSLTFDSAGNLYGTTQGDGDYGWGNIFKLTPSMGGWTYRSLYDFTGGLDGGSPCGGVTLDANGNLYGTAVHGGAYGYGVVWEIIP